LNLLKLRLTKTQEKVGTYYKYDIVKDEVPEIDAVLVKHIGDDIDLLILYNDPAPDICVAKFHELGPNKISAIKRVREATYWGLKESKDWVESFPRTVTAKELSKAVLKALVDGINAVGGSAELKLGTNCDKCELRFKCFTER